MNLAFLKKRLLKAVVASLAVGTFVGCNPQISFAQDFADTVVYSTIYTSNSKQDVAQAMAVKAGKYVYVGDKAGAAPFIDKNTKIINHPQGMVMAGATEGHGHYVLQSMEKLFMPTHAHSFKELLSETKAYVKQNPDKKIYVGVGWNIENGILPDVDKDFAKGLDKICADKPIILIDCDHHQGIVNTKAMELIFPKKNISLVAPDKEREDTASLEGGIVLRLPDGRANGYVRDQVIMYMANELMREAVDDKEYKAAIKDMQSTLHSQGYTNYNEGYINFYGDKVFAQLIKNDANGELEVNMRPNFVLFAYELKDAAGMAQALNRIDGYHQQTSKHVLPSGIKIFVDGVTESRTGAIDAPYLGTTDNYGNLVTPEETLYKLTKAANKKGIGIHTHSYGNVAVNYTVNAFINAQNEVNNGTRNTIAHARNVFDADYKRMADNNIAVAENIVWRTPMTPEYKKLFAETCLVPHHLQDSAYPVRSFVKNNVIVASSTDAPAANGYPTDVFNLVEMAVNPRAINWVDGLDKLEQDLYIACGFTPEKIDTLEITNADECVSVKDALDIMTINGAKYMGIDADRGSIEVGKSADFIMVDKNVLACPMNEIHTANIGKVYFEGKLVYEANRK